MSNFNKEFNPEKISLTFFTGYAGKIVGRTENRLRDLLEDKNIKCNFFHDRNRLFFLSGDDESSDEDMLVAKLSERLSEREINVFIGSSAGGFGAIKYGLQLNISGVICFSPFTSFSRQMQTLDARGDGIIQELMSMSKVDSDRDLKNLFDAHANIKTLFKIFYPTLSNEDTIQAFNLSHSNVEHLGLASKNHMYSDIKFNVVGNIMQQLRAIHSHGI